MADARGSAVAGVSERVRAMSIRARVLVVACTVVLLGIGLGLLRRPFDEQPDFERYAAPPPDWASSLSVSCSS